MKTGFIFLIAAIVTFCSLVPSLAGNAAGFAPLKLEGHLVKWGKAELGTPAHVTYAFVQQPIVQEKARNCGAMDSLARLARLSSLGLEDVRRQALLAFQLWQNVSGLTFEEIADVNAADILLGVQSIPRGFAFTNVRFQSEFADRPKSNVTDVSDWGLGKPGRQPEARSGATAAAKLARITRSAVCLNPVHKWKIGFDGDLKTYDLQYTFAHEIGHAIGLDHYLRKSSIMHFKYRETFEGLQPSDIEGVRWLYGARID